MLILMVNFWCANECKEDLLSSRSCAGVVFPPVNRYAKPVFGVFSKEFYRLYEHTARTAARDIVSDDFDTNRKSFLRRRNAKMA